MLKAIARRANSPGATRTGQIVSAAALLFSLFAGALIAIYGTSRPDISAPAAFGIFATGLVVSVLLAQLFYEMDGWYEQRRRDLTAKRIFDQLTDTGRAPDFILYLRPFHSTDQIATERTQTISATGSFTSTNVMAATSDRIEFEEEVERGLRKFAPVVALGKSVEHYGVGRIEVSDDRWQEAIRRLMKHAKLIILLPSPREGTAWEIDQLVETGAIERTILIDPPNERGSASEAYDPEAEWAGARSAFGALGYYLPEDNPEGQMFFFGAEKAPALWMDITLGGKSTIHQFARHALQHLKKTRT